MFLLLLARITLCLRYHSRSTTKLAGEGSAQDTVFSITLCSLQLSPFPRSKSLQGLVPPLAYCSELGGSKMCVREISLFWDWALYWETQVAAPNHMWCIGASKRRQNEDLFFITVLSKCQIKPGKPDCSEMRAARKVVCKSKNWWSVRLAGHQLNDCIWVYNDCISISL